MVRCLKYLLFFDIALLYCYTNLNSSIICCLSSGDMYLSYNFNFNSPIIFLYFYIFLYKYFFGTNLNSSIISCLSYEDMYLFFGTCFGLALPTSFGLALPVSTIVLPFYNSLVDFFQTLHILSGILLQIESPVSSVVFWIALFDAVFISSDVDLLALSRSFWPYLLLKFLPMFFTKSKNPYPYAYILFVGSIEYLIFIIFI